MKTRNNLREALEAGRHAFGPNLQFPLPWLVELIGACGFEYVLLDGEHGAAFDDLSNLIIAADNVGTTPIVRVPSHERAWLLRPLEYGAGGVQVPMVHTAQQAARIVEEVKFSPLGRRGFSTVTRAAGFGTIRAGGLAEHGNRATMLILQIESEQGLENARAIAETPGVDMIFLGPADLAQSLGVTGESTSPRVVDAMRAVIDDIGERVPVGTSAFSAEEVNVWSDLGVRCFLTSSVHPIRRAFEELHANLARGVKP